ncbi:MAG TPA: branched-chain amino acid ABC transporter ATP-binding protein/permease [Conexibacter sp.]|jgi:branched-chain amino acid transport system permease protein
MSAIARLRTAAASAGARPASAALRPAPYRRRYFTGLLIFIAVALLAEFLYGTASDTQHLVNLWLVYTIAIVGFYFVFGLGGRFAFCQTLMMAVGGYTTAYFSVHIGFWPALVLGVGVTAVLAAILAILTIRVQAFYFAIATLAASQIGIEILRNWSGFAGANGVQVDIDTPTWFGTELIDERSFFWVILGVVVLVLLLAILVERSPLRRNAVAARERELAAESSGVHAKRLQIGLFVFGSALGAVAGALLAGWEATLSPDTFSIDLAIAIFVGVIIGGVGSMWGAVVGAAFVVFLPEVLTGLEQYQTIIYGAILLGGVVFLPRGIAGIGNDLRGLVLTRLGIGGREEEAREADAAVPREPEPAAEAARETGTPLFDPRAAAAAEPPGEPLLDARDIVVQFGGLRAVDGVSLTVRRPGEILGVVGPNGSGKSTFLNAISGVQPFAGSVTVRGRPIHSGRRTKARAAGLSRGFQTAQNFSDLTCLDNVLVGAADRSMTGFLAAWLARVPMWRRERVRWREAQAALHRVGLVGVEDLPARSLTYGQHRLLELARCLAGRPEVLVLDEPSAGLNDAETDLLADLIEQLASEGLSILLVEHKIDFVNRLCQRILVIDAGKPIAEGTPSEVWNHPRVAAAFLGSAVSHA